MNRESHRELREEISTLHARICSALADANRILILYTLADQPRCVSDLADLLELSQPTVSRHLKVLRERSLVNAQREGQSMIYSLADQRIIQALDLLRGILADRLRDQGALGQSVSEEFDL